MASRPTPDPRRVPVPSVVLDSNAVLDAWWFGDPRAAAIVRAIVAGRVRWMASGPMRAELADVVARPAFAHEPGAGHAVLNAYDRWARPCPCAAPVPQARCADPKDQMFVDLAVATGARWLFSRDRALLDLAGPLRRWDCVVVAPQDWPGDDLPAAAAAPGP